MTIASPLIVHNEQNSGQSLRDLYQQLQQLQQLFDPQGTFWRGRLAPTPSGYLHSGNLLNFLLNWLLLRSLNGEVGLRIDDMDDTRSRPEYIESILQTLDWLGLDWDFGPQSLAEQQQASFSYVQPELRQLTQQLLAEQKAYACGCSRKDLRGHFRYPGYCRQQERAWQPQKNAIRFAAERESAGQFNDDWVIWSRDDFASYQLASVWQDNRDQVNFILRGEDLIDSSRFQKLLANSLGFNQFQQSPIWHHPLITHPQGGKLSKSAGAQGEPIYLSGLHAQDIIQQCARWLGLSERSVAKIKTTEELLEVFQNQLLEPGQ